MALILAIETATEVCSVSLFNDTTILHTIDNELGSKHLAILHPGIQQIMQECGKTLTDLDAISVSSGPGSYTGLRIGVSAAKGICYAIDRPLIAINTLESIAYGIQHILSEKQCTADLFFPTIDARRMDVYAAVFQNSMIEIQSTEALTLNEQSFSNWNHASIAIGGNGVSKMKTFPFDHSALLFLDENVHSAKHQRIPAIEKYNGQKFEDVAYFEPFYLKDFIPGKPSVKGLK